MFNAHEQQYKARNLVEVLTFNYACRAKSE